MIDRLKGYWLEILVLVCSLGYFIALAAPDMTWVNVDSDGSAYINAAKHWALTHPTGAPLYNMFNWFIVRIPIGAEYWRLCMVSAIAAGVTSMFLYLLAKRYTPNRLKALIAPLVFCASGVVVSQATILDTYALITMMSVLAFWFHVKGMHRAKYLTIGLGIGIHHLILIPLGVLWIADVIARRKAGLRVVRPAMFMWLFGFLFYAYVPLANHPPYNWIEGETFGNYLNYFFSQGGLIGGLSINTGDLVMRMQDFIVITAVSFGISGLLILPAIVTAFKQKDMEGVLLFFLFIFPLFYYATNMAPQVYTYTMPAFAFGGLLAVKGSQYFTLKRMQVALPALVAVTSVFLIGFNIQTYDIGRNLDRDMVMVRYYESLDELPDGAYVWTENGGWWRGTVWLYNSDKGRDLTILPVFGYEGEENIRQAREAFDSGDLWIQEYEDTVERSWESSTRPAVEADFERIERTAQVLYEWEAGRITTGWTNPIDLITGRAEPMRWGVATRSDHTAAFVLVAFAWCASSQSVADFLFKKRAGDSKKKLQAYRWATFIGMLALLMVIFSLLGMEAAI
ncbi:MAG: DUF2723 domain-containing protein [Sphaerochaeta sp.]|jgi:hypothetical protein|nr:DUF2723 domain-containing protein [Sphaerochaeta sp.]